jgi:hypothetical protein
MASPIASVVHLEQSNAKGVETAIRQASEKTGVDFSYLMAQATAESGLNPKAKAGTSSAAGLYQFIERTWLDMVDRHGAKYGLDKQAALIGRGDDGRPAVNGSDKDRKAILDLRYNPEVASLMAGEYAAENRRYLQEALDQNINGTDLYFAHFLGGGGAARFLKALDQNPNQKAAAIMPDAAAANYNVFYDKSTGKARSLQQVYDRFAAKFKDIQDLSAPSTQVAALTPPPSPAASEKITTLIPVPKSPSSWPVASSPSGPGGDYWQKRGMPSGLSAFADDATVRSLLQVLQSDRDGLLPSDQDQEKNTRYRAEIAEDQVQSSGHRFGMQGFLLSNLLQAQIEANNQ